jgi:hypothetical protein
MVPTTARAVFPSAPLRAGMYESFYLRAVDPERPRGVWVRYTAHKRPGRPPRGSLWCTFFDATRARPFMAKLTTDALAVPDGGWIAIGAGATLGPSDGDAAASHSDAAPSHGHAAASQGGGADIYATGECGGAGWSLGATAAQAPLRHLPRAWMYRAALPRTKPTSPAPAARFDGALELPGAPSQIIDVRAWRGMIGHNWGAEHAERWIWLHGVCFAESPDAWLDVVIGRIRIAGRATPWVANGVLSLDGQRHRLGGLGARGLLVAETPTHCRLSLPGAAGLTVEAHVDAPADALAGWRYVDPDGADHDVSNCSIASLTLTLNRPGRAARTLHSAHGAAYELGMREHDHGVPLAPFADG